MRTSRAVRITAVSAVASRPAALAARAAKARPRASRARTRPTRKAVNQATAVEVRLNAMESRQLSAGTQTRRRQQSHPRTAPRRNSARWKQAEKSHQASRSAPTANARRRYLVEERLRHRCTGWLAASAHDSSTTPDALEVRRRCDRVVDTSPCLSTRPVERVGVQTPPRGATWQRQHVDAVRSSVA